MLLKRGSNSSRFLFWVTITFIFKIYNHVIYYGQTLEDGKTVKVKSLHILMIV